MTECFVDVDSAARVDEGDILSLGCAFHDGLRQGGRDFVLALYGTRALPVCGRSLRLDADVLAWLKNDGQGYQTRVNQMLRERMVKELEA